MEYCREKNIQLGRLTGMRFDGAATFSGDKTRVQRRLKELSPHAIFVHCRCHVLQLASVHAANATPGIKHIYSTRYGSSFITSQNMQSQGNSESTRSSRAQDCESVRHTLACTSISLEKHFLTTRCCVLYRPHIVVSYIDHTLLCPI